MKKYLLFALIILIVVQIAAPISMIINRYDILKNGEEFKFKVNPVDPYDAFRGRYVSLYYRQDVWGEGKYGTIVVREDGFAKLEKISNEKPDGSVYVKSNKSTRFNFPIDRYYMDEKFAPQAEALTRKREPGKDTYVTVRIKKGKLVISGLYIDGVAIEEIIKKNINKN